MRTGEGRATENGAGTVIGEAREFVAVDLHETGFDVDPPNRTVGAEPGPVPTRVARHTPNVRVGVAGVGPCTVNSVVEEHPLEPRAAREGSTLIVDAGDSEVAGELNFRNTFNGGVKFLGGDVSIDVSEQGRWLDGVGSSARSSKVVHNRDW